MAIVAVKPEVVLPSKPKMLISGASGVGKTFFALSWPKVLMIDTEGGATRPQYQKKLMENGGMYIGKDQGSQDFDVVINQIKDLITTKHDFQTLIIDSVSYLYLLEASKAEERIGSDFGKDRKEANKPSRQLLRWIEKLDMSVLLIAHSKDKWSRKGKEIICEGSTFDFFDKTEYFLDIWIEIQNRNFIVKKSRIDSLPQGSSFPLEYSKFAELYGKEIIEKESTPVAIALPEQVTRIEALIAALNVPAEEIEKLKKKFDVDEWSELTQDQISKGIAYFEAKLNALNPAATVAKKGK